jgi:hypothetical protein
MVQLAFSRCKRGRRMNSVTEEIDYYRRRLAQEIEMAEAADCPNVRDKHLDLVEQYSDLLDRMRDELPEA